MPGRRLRSGRWRSRNRVKTPVKGATRARIVKSRCTRANSLAPRPAASPWPCRSPARRSCAAGHASRPAPRPEGEGPIPELAQTPVGGIRNTGFSRSPYWGLARPPSVYRSSLTSYPNPVPACHDDAQPARLGVLSAVPQRPRRTTAHAPSGRQLGLRHVGGGIESRFRLSRKSLAPSELGHFYRQILRLRLTQRDHSYTC